MKQKIIFLALLLIISACAPRLYEVKDTQDIMGTFVTITVHHEDKQVAKEAVDAAFREIRKIDSLLSSYKNDSEITLLNNEKFVSASPDLLANIRKSIYYSELSNGSFDITVQPILDLYTESFGKTGNPPADAEITKELKKVDYKRIKVNDNLVSIGDNQEITLGGIAKGYAVDKAIEILKSYGIKNALVNAGGDMYAIGKKYGTVDWEIALANPRNKEDYIEIIPLTNEAVVTSGDYERYFNENKTFHHIINPKTGYSATELISVTILADDAFDADAISTTVFVLGKEKGLDLIESLNNTEGILITRDKEIIKSSGLI